MASSFAALAMPHFVSWEGVFPPRGGEGGYTFFHQGMIEPFAGTIRPFGAPTAQGQHLSISGHHMLFAIFGTSFGGNGRNEFRLPNLEGRVAVGGSPVGKEGPQTLALTWLIAASKSDMPFAGTLIAFGGSYVPDGWLAADGSLLPISSNRSLFDAIGTTYGGDGVKDFALPDLKDAAPVGAGRGPGLPPVELGQKMSGEVPRLGLNYLICTSGMYPPSDGKGDLPSRDSYYGQVIAFAGAKAPSGWALCDGALLSILDNMPLYSMIGDRYGGDGQKTFALPDLRGRMLMGPEY
ncbi:MAG TPA: tail fiber protein [Allosphingosinicella sp.]